MEESTISKQGDSLDLTGKFVAPMKILRRFLDTFIFASFLSTEGKHGSDPKSLRHSLRQGILQKAALN